MYAFGALQPSGGLFIGVGIFAILMALIGCFYYLRIVKIMYFDEAVESYPAPTGWTQTDLLLALNTVLLIALGLMPDALIWLCAKVIYFTLGL